MNKCMRQVKCMFIDRVEKMWMNVNKLGSLENGNTSNASWSAAALMLCRTCSTCCSALIPPRAVYRIFRDGGAMLGWEILASSHSLTISKSAIPSSNASAIFSPAVRVSLVCFPTSPNSASSSLSFSGSSDVRRVFS